jgi:hypothetical protein
MRVSKNKEKLPLWRYTFYAIGSRIEISPLSSALLLYTNPQHQHTWKQTNRCRMEFGCVFLKRKSSSYHGGACVRVCCSLDRKNKRTTRRIMIAVGEKNELSWWSVWSEKVSWVWRNGDDDLSSWNWNEAKGRERDKVSTHLSLYKKKNRHARISSRPWHYFIRGIHAPSPLSKTVWIHAKAP